MKKVVVLLVIFISLSAQSADIGIIFADHDINMFKIGGSYQFMDVKVADQKVPLFGVASFAKGAESVFDLTAFELGAKGHYIIQDKIYAKAALLLSFITTTVNKTILFGGNTANSETSLSLELGAGYEITDKIFAELNFALTGLDGLRLGVGYNF